MPRFTPRHCLVLAALTLVAQAGVPQRLAVSGRLTDTTGAWPIDGAHTFTASLVADLPDGGVTLVLPARPLTTTTTQGYFSLELDTAGLRLTLYLRTGLHDNRETAFRYAKEDAVSVFYWVDGSTAYALSGELDRERLLNVAQAVYKGINP